MRADAIGLFWEDTPKVRIAKEAPAKRQPPERTWERPDYLPGLEAAQRFDVNLFTDDELVGAALEARIYGQIRKFTYDIESYPNYFLIAFECITTGKVIYFEEFVVDGVTVITYDRRKLLWVIENFCQISFNGIGYDAAIAALAIAGFGPEELQQATYEIIVEQSRPSDVLRSRRVKKLQFDHIDLIEVAPLRASLKIYAGRLHTKRMQDLPFIPGTRLSHAQMLIVRWYCLNDLAGTKRLHNSLIEQLDLRATMSAEYRIDLRSKSDAQIAEAVIGFAVADLNGARCQRPEIPVGTAYHYKVPHNLRYSTPLMNWVLSVVANAWFIVGESGSIVMPAELAELKINIANSVYQMGIGGLHSTESGAVHTASDDYVLRDVDVESYYPRIILNQELFPQHLGRAFLQVYKTIVERRIAAKEAGNKVVADSLKITINGSFGKFGSKWSILYAPDLLIQTTISGQLYLLMLIERLELAGINVVSANTDGVVIKIHKTMYSTYEAIVQQWRVDTGFKTEETRYSALYSRDVNNYIAVYEKPIEKNGKFTYAKFKGAYSNSGLSKNPANYACVKAVQDLLIHRKPIEQSIRENKDIRDFVSVRTVKGGAVKVWEDGDTEYLGKSIRWYYAAGVSGELVYALSGNKVPRSDGAKPCMDLPDEFPNDIDYDWYIKESEKILVEIGYAGRA